MGVLPLQFKAGENARVAEADRDARNTRWSAQGPPEARGEVRVQAKAADGTVTRVHGHRTRSTRQKSWWPSATAASCPTWCGSWYRAPD